MRIWIYILFLQAPLIAQTPSSVFLLQLNTEGENWTVDRVQMLSDYNPGGYNNQPHFYSPTELLITSAPKSALNETDIYSLDLVRNQVTRITATEEREYSPSRSFSGNEINCVLVDTTGAQILWSYPRTGENQGSLITRQEGTIGYFTFLNDSLVAEFRVDSVPTLYVYNTISQKSEWVSRNIARCIKTDSNGHLVFIQKHSDRYWFIKKWNPETKRIEIIKKTLPEVQDFELFKTGLIAGKEGKIYYLANDGMSWIEVIDLSAYGINNITRLAFDGKNRIALVNVSN